MSHHATNCDGHAAYTILAREIVSTMLKRSLLFLQIYVRHGMTRTVWQYFSISLSIQYLKRSQGSFAVKYRYVVVPVHLRHCPSADIYTAMHASKWNTLTGKPGAVATSRGINQLRRASTDLWMKNFWSLPVSTNTCHIFRLPALVSLPGTVQGICCTIGRSRLYTV